MEGFQEGILLFILLFAFFFVFFSLVISFNPLIVKFFQQKVGKVRKCDIKEVEAEVEVKKGIRKRQIDRKGHKVKRYGPRVEDYLVNGHFRISSDSNVNNFQEVLDQLLENEELLQSIKDFSCMVSWGSWIDISEKVLKCIQKSPNIISVYFSSNEFPFYEVVESLVVALQDKKRFKGLNFSGCRISVTGMESLCDNLQFIPLQVLSLCGISMHDDEAYYLAKFLEFNSNLDQLFLHSNVITSTGANYFANALLHNTCLRVLDLSNNQITNSGVSSIFISLRENKSLRSLSLAWNFFDENIQEDIFTTFETNFSLVSFGTYWTKLPPSLTSKIEEKLQRNIKLKEAAETFNCMYQYSLSSNQSSMEHLHLYPNFLKFFKITESLPNEMKLLISSFSRDITKLPPTYLIENSSPPYGTEDKILFVLQSGPAKWDIT